MQEIKEIIGYMHKVITQLMSFFIPLIAIITATMILQEWFNFVVYAKTILVFVSGVAGVIAIVGYLMAFFIGIVNTLKSSNMNALKGILFGIFCIFLHILS